MEEHLSLDFLRVVENAAIAAARTMGFGDRHKADEVAVEAMRKTMDQVEMDGTIVIGEGERDEAPMLYIGEKVGLATHAPKALFPSSRYRRRSPRRHQSLRHRRAERHRRPRRQRTRRPAPRSRSVHGKNRRRALLQGRGRARRTGRGQPESCRQASGPRRGRPGGRWCSTVPATKK